MVQDERYRVLTEAKTSESIGFYLDRQSGTDAFPTDLLQHELFRKQAKHSSLFKKSDGSGQESTVIQHESYFETRPDSGFEIQIDTAKPARCLGLKSTDPNWTSSSNHEDTFASFSFVLHAIDVVCSYSIGVMEVFFFVIIINSHFAESNRPRYRF